MNQKPNQIILGVDPGTAVTGYGVISSTGQGVQALDYGCIRPPAKLPLPDRYLILFESISEIIQRHSPQEMAIETQYVDKNVRSALTVGMARGAILVAARKLGVQVFEYSPTEAKRAVVGKGNASKKQVQGMVQKLLNLQYASIPEDAADAIALAFCHSHRSNFRTNLKQGRLCTPTSKEH